MAVLKFGSIVTEGSGSIAGHTVQRSKGGVQLRTKPIPRGLPSPAQVLIRSYNTAMQAGWRALTDAQRIRWNDYAAPALAGHSLWMKLQFPFSVAKLPFKTDPAAAALGPFGPELIINGAFNGQPPWIIIARWAINNGKAHFDDTGVRSFYQPLILPLGAVFRLTFDISNVITAAWITFTNEASSLCFTAPFTGYAKLQNGSYSYFVTTTRACTWLQVWGDNTGSTYSIDNISLKRVL